MEENSNESFRGIDFQGAYLDEWSTLVVQALATQKVAMIENAALGAALSLPNNILSRHNDPTQKARFNAPVWEHCKVGRVVRVSSFGNEIQGAIRSWNPESDEIWITTDPAYASRISSWDVIDILPADDSVEELEAWLARPNLRARF